TANEPAEPVVAEEQTETEEPSETSDGVAMDGTGEASGSESPKDPDSRALPTGDAEADDDDEIASGWKEMDFDLPKKNAIAAFSAPPGATALSKTGRLWVDRAAGRVYLDGYVTLRQGPLEMFACPVGTKEHESIVAAIAASSEVHAALLAIEATPGSPVRYRPEFSPPTGEVIRVWVCWYDEGGEFHVVDGRSWVRDIESKKELEADWVFAGSGFWEDPEEKREYYRADSGDMICVSNFASAMLDVSIESSAEGDFLQFEPFADRIPPRETPVRLVLAMVPAAEDGSAPVEPMEPTKKEVPRGKAPVEAG
ncbi:MAG: YdjY domain-containing protein, partial [Planctomycetota bacterium]